MDPERFELFADLFNFSLLGCDEGLGPLAAGSSERLSNLGDFLKVSLVNQLLRIAETIKDAHSSSVYQYLQARRVAAAGEAFPFGPPPQSDFLKFVQRLKTDSHPSFVALGRGDDPPASTVEDTEDPGPFDNSIPMEMHPDTREMLTKVIDIHTGIIDLVIRSLVNLSTEDERNWEPVRRVLIAGVVCILLGLAEDLEHIHYVQDLRWSGLESLFIAKGNPSFIAQANGGGSNTGPLPKPERPPILHFLEAFKSAAKLAFPILGVAVDKGGEE